MAVIELNGNAEDADKGLGDVVKALDAVLTDRVIDATDMDDGASVKDLRDLARAAVLATAVPETAAPMSTPASPVLADRSYDQLVKDLAVAQAGLEDPTTPGGMKILFGNRIKVLNAQLAAAKDMIGSGVGSVGATRDSFLAQHEQLRVRVMDCLVDMLAMLNMSRVLCRGRAP